MLQQPCVVYILIHDVTIAIDIDSTHSAALHGFRMFCLAATVIPIQSR